MSEKIAAEAKDEADAIKDHGYFATTIGYDVLWKCTEATISEPQATNWSSCFRTRIRLDAARLRGLSRLRVDAPRGPWHPALSRL